MVNQLRRENMGELLAITDHYRTKELREAAIKFTKLNIFWLHEDQRRMAELKNFYMNLILELV